MDRKALFKEALILNPSYAPALYSLAGILTPNEKTKLGEVEFDTKSLYLEALKSNSSFFYSFSKLSSLLEAEEKIRLHGREFDSIGLLAEALRYDNSVDSILLLASKVKDSVNLHDGRKMEKKDLLVRKQL